SMPAVRAPKAANDGPTAPVDDRTTGAATDEVVTGGSADNPVGGVLWISGGTSGHIFFVRHVDAIPLCLDRWVESAFIGLPMVAPSHSVRTPPRAVASPIASK